MFCGKTMPARRPPPTQSKGLFSTKLLRPAKKEFYPGNIEFFTVFETKKTSTTFDG